MCIALSCYHTLSHPVSCVFHTDRTPLGGVLESVELVMELVLEKYFSRHDNLCRMPASEDCRGRAWKLVVNANRAVGMQLCAP